MSLPLPDISLGNAAGAKYSMDDQFSDDLQVQSSI